MTCHCGPNHTDDAQDHGAWGWLCSDCWAWCQRFIERLRRKG